jgi:hypothetical protein
MQGCKDTNFLISLYINVRRNIDMYIIVGQAKFLMASRIVWGHDGVRWAKFWT